MKNRERLKEDRILEEDILESEVYEEKEDAEEKGFLPVSILAAVLFAAIVIVAAFIFFSSADSSASSSKSGLVMKDTEESEISVLPADIRMTAVEYKEPYLIVKITNQTGETVTYGEEYFLQKMSENGWLNVSPVKHYTWPSTSHELKDLGEATEKYDLSVYGKLQPGEYRLVKADMSAEFILE